MKVMKMPGFTAEASFYQTREPHMFASARAEITGPQNQGLFPQLKDSDLPGATCGKAPVFGNVICVECTPGPFPTCKTYVCDKDGNNCKQTVRINRQFLAGSLAGGAIIRRL
jgi:hypothetical protein